jgi:hypothetical protein
MKNTKSARLATMRRMLFRYNAWASPIGSREILFEAEQRLPSPSP